MGKTIFISSHILAELATLCDSVTIIDQGAIRYSGTMDDLLAQEGTTVTYLLTLAVEDPATEQALRDTDGVEQVLKVEDGPAYQVTFDTQRVTTNDVLHVALHAQGRIVSFRRSVRHLQEAFMDLTEPGVPT